MNLFPRTLPPASPKNLCPNRGACLVRSILAGSIVAAASAHAASGTWIQISSGNASGTWSEDLTANWQDGIVAGGSASTADFSTLDMTATSTITLGEPRTIGNLMFGDTTTSSAASWVLNNGGSATNILTLAGGTPTITVNALGTNALATISASIEGTQGIVKAGAGTLVLSGANSGLSGAIAVNAGALRAQNSAALGSGAVTVASGGRLQLHGSVNIGNAVNISGSTALDSSSRNNTVSGTVTLQSNSTVSAQNQSNTSLTLGDIDLGGNTLTASAAAATQGLLFINGTITGAGNIVKTSNGPLTIANDQTATYSGTTTLQGGTLVLGHSGSLGTGTFASMVSNDASAIIRSSDSTPRVLANAVTIGGGNANSVRVFGATSGGTGNLTFTNTTNIALGTVVRQFDVHNTTQFDAGFTGSGGILKQNGVGTLVLNGANTYTGATTVNAGTLLVNGSVSGTMGGITIGSAGTLGGIGSITGNTTVSGTLAPGVTTESIEFGGNLTLTGDVAKTIFDINGTSRGASIDGYDAVDLTNPAGILTYDGVLTLTMTGLIADGTYDLFAFTAPALGAFDSIVFAGGAYTGAFAGSGGVWTATAENGQSFTFTEATGDLVVIPEPASCAMLLGGLGMLLGFRRGRRAA